MGVALALGVTLGVQAAQQPLLLGVVILSLVAVGRATLAFPRAIVTLLVVGTLCGATAMSLRGTQTQHPVDSHIRQIVARVVSDPAVTSRGVSARIEWSDPHGHVRRSLALLPPAPEIGRGETIEAAVTSYGLHSEQIIVSQHRVIAPAGRVESLRRSIREHMAETTSDRISGSAGTLTLGLLIGDDSALTSDERSALRQSGLSHITAVSGWNVTLVTGAIGAVFLAFGRRGWFWLLAQLSLMAAYVWIVGLDPPVTRAAIMAVVALTGVHLGRPAHSITALTLAAALMVALDPVIVTSLSFQLSVIATFALISAMKLTENLKGWWGALTTIVLACLLTGIATAPVLAATFGTLSLATVPANVLAGSLIPIASIGGVLVVALDVVPIAGEVAGWIVWLLASVVLVIARLCAALPYGYLEFQPLSPSGSAVVHLLVIMSIAALTPEGRLIRLRMMAWIEHEPRAAIATAAGAALSLVIGLVVV